MLQCYAPPCSECGQITLVYAGRTKVECFNCDLTEDEQRAVHVEARRRSRAAAELHREMLVDPFDGGGA